MWQLYAFIFSMIFFVLALVCWVVYSVAKQDNPDLASPFTKEYWR